MTKHKKYSNKMFKYYAFAGFWLGFVLGILFFHAILGNASGMIDASPAITSFNMGSTSGSGQAIQAGDLYLRHDIEQYIKTKFGKDGQRALKIAYCESKLNVDATHVNRNGTIDRGIFQLNSIHKNITWECAFNARCNIDAAYQLYLKQGFRPWVCKGL